MSGYLDDAGHNNFIDRTTDKAVLVHLLGVKAQAGNRPIDVDRTIRDTLRFREQTHQRIKEGYGGYELGGIYKKGREIGDKVIYGLAKDPSSLTMAVGVDVVLSAGEGIYETHRRTQLETDYHLKSASQRRIDSAIVTSELTRLARKDSGLAQVINALMKDKISAEIQDRPEKYEQSSSYVKSSESLKSIRKVMIEQGVGFTKNEVHLKNLNREMNNLAQSIARQEEESRKAAEQLWNKNEAEQKVAKFRNNMRSAQVWVQGMGAALSLIDDRGAQFMVQSSQEIMKFMDMAHRFSNPKS